MYLSYENLMRLPAAERAELFQKVTVQHAGKFYNLELSALGQLILGEIPNRIEHLETTPVRSPWDRPIVLSLKGGVNGSVTFDGTQDVEMEVRLDTQSIGLDDIEGLPTILLGLTQQVEQLAGGSYSGEATKLAKPIKFVFKGDVNGEISQFDASSDVEVSLKFSEHMRKQLMNAFLGTVKMRAPDTSRVTYNGTIAVVEGGSDLPQSSGLLWNSTNADASHGGQFYQGAGTGRLWHRMKLDGEQSVWEEVWTARRFNPESKAGVNDALGVARSTADLKMPSKAALNRWDSKTKNAPTASGLYLELTSANGIREPLAGNEINRLMFAPGARVILQQNTDGETWTDSEFWHNRNFDPSLKADLSNPQFRTGVGIYPGKTGTVQNLLHVGWTAGKHRWKMDLEADASLTLNAYSADQKERHRLARFSSRLAGVGSVMEVLANRTVLGVGTTTAVYGFAGDKWGMFNTPNTIGWTDGTNPLTYISKHDRALIHNGAIEATDRVEGSRFYANWDAGAPGGMSCDNWFRSSGPSGWMNATYGGGWYMTNEKYIRAYNDKRVLAGGFSVSFKNINRGTVKVLDYRGPLRPVQFFNISEQNQDFGFDLNDLSQNYPEATEVRDGVSIVSVNAIGAILSAQANAIQTELGDTNTRVEQLESELADMRAQMAELHDLLDSLTK